MMRAALVLCLVACCFVASVSAGRRDGIPRPLNVNTLPTYTYGSTPPAVDDLTGTIASCIWYGWDNIRFPVLGAQCSIYLRSFLTNETLTAGVPIIAFEYYHFNNSAFLDPTTKDPYCYQGCFDLSGSTPPPESAPPTGLPPSPSTISPPPPTIPPPPPTILPSPPPPNAFPPSPMPSPITPSTPSPADQVTPSTPSTPIFRPNNAGFLLPSALGTRLAVVVGVAVLMLNVMW